ncbi:MAG: type II toxin-antitoxin system VapC family toxin [Rhodospirillaceae bacterium]|nr:type II toxin-antitoxin system VapC family toxin [Rhodospirillaceae bacterium]
MFNDGVLVDTNVVLDVVGDSPDWGDWSQEQLERFALTHRLVINPVIYAEISAGFRDIAELEQTLQTMGLSVEPIPREALFLAGKAFQRYRKAKGRRIGVLPDFFIGAHAAVTDMAVLTRDKGRYRTYFPTIRLIAP